MTAESVDEPAELSATTPGQRPRRIHPAWIVALVALIALIGAAGFRAAPGVLMLPLQDEFGWTTAELSLAVTVNLLLFGLTAPFAAALMQRFGIRSVTVTALFVIGAGAALSVFVATPAQLILTWGVLIGLGTGSMALVFAATITDTWFATRRGLVSGVLTAGSATGQLIFLPVIAVAAQDIGWRGASLIIAGGALAVVPLVWIFLRNRPSDLGVNRYGDTGPLVEAPRPMGNAWGAARLAITTLRDAARTKTFWALAIGFAICGATTNGLIGTHFIPSAHDHGMPTTTAAGLLAVVGIFDIAGTVFSGWLTDRVNPRILLAAYYALRGVSLLFLPSLLSAEVQPSIVVFIVIYGLDWVATVPPTIALCREVFGDRGPLVFGWVFASHQIGAGIASVLAGLVRDHTGQYTVAWFAAAGLCAVAALVSATIRRHPAPVVPD
ncbi:MFS transporter [Microbacterium phyllosphaerae]|uniref:MFS transporter n=1 Tax=Microbacterium phyllosphaerae TaxID=124798 RepID=UPI0021688D2E|nr:MFS transporter [Microbacterium phyllosphaerae]MCS3442659.1 MFS family permease [Microbacterium phyllosphaerae]